MTAVLYNSNMIQIYRWIILPTKILYSLFAQISISTLEHVQVHEYVREGLFQTDQNCSNNRKSSYALVHSSGLGTTNRFLYSL